MHKVVIKVLHGSVGLLD